MSELDSPTRLAEVRQQIDRAARLAGRKAADVTLIAISKTHEADAIRPLIAAGQREFGENRVQEAQAKWPALCAETPDIALHLVGQLQSNKADDAVALFDVIHSVDRPSLVTALARAMDRGGRRPDCFIQVNIGDEPQKGGCAIADLPALLAEARRSELPVAGLMAVPPLNVEPAPYFALLAKLARDHGLTGLSMGMSGDYPTAITIGATHIRVGSALFRCARMRIDGILFDFDGVIIESEYEGNAHIADYLSRIGHATSVEHAMTHFMGLAGQQFIDAIEGWIGRPLPDDFHAERAAEDARAMRDGVGAVTGAIDFIQSLPADLPIAIASSSSHAWIRRHLAHNGLLDRFDGRIFSGKEDVPPGRGKPEPDLYLLAAAALGLDIRRTVILEDSPVGVTGALKSGAMVIGMVAANHCLNGHGDRLRAIGVEHIADDYDAVRDFIGLPLA